MGLTRKMGLTSLCSSFPSARRGGSSKELHCAKKLIINYFVFIVYICK